jgi:hypothetical protein
MLLRVFLTFQCGGRSTVAHATDQEWTMRVTVLYFEGCPNWRAADARLRALADEPGFTVDRRVVDTPDEAERMRFRGSPTILVDGRDPFASGDEPVGLSCRVYDTPQGPAGAPTAAQLRAVLR